MDQLTVDLLRSWGFEDYVRPFVDGKIDSGTLRILTDDEIRQLIPVPGDRARFKINLSNWKKELADLNLQEPEIETSFDVGDLELGNLGTLLRESIDDTEFNLTSSTPVSKRLRTLDDRAPPINIPIQEPQIVPCERSQRAAEDLGQQFSVAAQRGYVLKILKSTVDGRSLLRNRDTGKFDDFQRNLLVKLLIAPIFEENPHAKITNKELLTWSLEIQEIFNKESAALYYTPYVSALVHTTARNASGKLLRYVYNKRQQFRSRGIIEKARSCSSNGASSSSSSNSDLAPLIRLPAASAETNEEIQEKLNWLRNSLEPWHLVAQNWSDTAAFRLRINYLGATSLQEYFNEYPVLKSPAGHELLQDDFKVMYSDKTDALFTSLTIHTNKIAEVAKKRVENTRDKDIKQSMQVYLNAISDAEGPDVKINGALLLLPYITSSVPLKEKRKTLWKPSKSEVRDGFITQIGSDAELEAVVTERKNKLLRYGKSLQPFIVFVGPSIEHVSHCYIAAGDIYYKVPKLINAVDICFKIFHATGAKYQSEAFVIWMLIQKAFYRIDTPYDKELTTVKSLLVDLGI